MIAGALTSSTGQLDDQDTTRLVAAPLPHGSNPNSNAAGRRREDDENLVCSVTLASDPISARNLAQPITKRNGDPGVVSTGASVRRLTPTECERLQGFPDGWTDLGGTADTRRYAALGDAVTVQVAYWIADRIARGNPRAEDREDTSAREGALTSEGA